MFRRAVAESVIPKIISAIGTTPAVGKIYNFEQPAATTCRRSFFCFYIQYLETLQTSGSFIARP
jgi:hypothetical protein